MSANGKGRPTLYKPAYCAQVIKFMARGYTLTAFAGSIGAHRDSVYEWAEKHPEFSDAVKKAKAKQVWYWERRLHTAGSRLGDTAPVIFALKNSCPDEWRQQPEVSVAVTNQPQVNLDKPVEEWGKLELEAELIRRNALPKIPAVKIPINTERNGHG